jgi:hypothetical protein
MLHERGRPVMEALQRMLSIVLSLHAQLAAAAPPLPPAAVDRVLATRPVFRRCGEFLYSILAKFGEKTKESDIEGLVMQLNFNGWLQPLPGK